MKRVLVGFVLLVASCWANPVLAQTAPITGRVVTACDASAFAAGSNQFFQLKTTGALCVTGTIAVTIAGTISENLAQVNGVTVNTGVGNATTGTQRVFPGFAGATQYNISTTSAATAEIIPLSGSTVTYVLLDKIIVDGTGAVTWKYGTGSNCGTGTTTLEGPYNLTAQNGWVEGDGIGPVMIVPAGKALCLTTSAGTTQYTGKVLAVQF